MALGTNYEVRKVLSGYHPRLLKVLIGAAAVASVTEYLTYTLTSKMGTRFPYLWVTTIFVAWGILRYALLAKENKDTGRPEKTLLTDKILWVILAGYGISSVTVVALGL